MKFTSLLILILGVFSLFIGASDARPKIPINAIRKGARAVGKGLRMINYASTAHDIASMFHKKKRKH
ncbi:virescein [Bicyclus anynana]|uniref:Virescein n=1 Tax=Bicyclus anynana TaxID=110368 RepID=A0A6J1N779_BICAN|nr:virescein [Bicyclus anynana]